MSQPAARYWKNFPVTVLLIGAGGCLGFMAGGLSPHAPQPAGPNSATPAPLPAKNSKETGKQNPAVRARQELWLTSCREASGRSVKAWAEALASAPQWMRDPAWRGELERFVATAQAEGVAAAMKEGISGADLSMAIANQVPAEIPFLMEAIFTDPTLVAPADFGQIAHDASKAGIATGPALAPLAGHLLTFHEEDQAALDDFGSSVGRFHPEYVKTFVQNLPSEESRESILSAAMMARAESLPAGPALTSEIENFVVGEPALKAAFEKTGLVKGNDRTADGRAATLAWTRSLDGYRQEAALKGWINAVSDERPVTEPLARMLADPESVKDAAFFAKVVELSSPAITKEGESGLKALSALLGARPDRQSILDAQPALRALLEEGPKNTGGNP